MVINVEISRIKMLNSTHFLWKLLSWTSYYSYSHISKYVENYSTDQVSLS